jgi:hypothetical protein
MRHAATPLHRSRWYAEAKKEDTRARRVSNPVNEASKSSVVLDRELDADKSQSPSDPRIRCPLCGWSPRKEDKWFCTCGYDWNTFETGGVCPACLHQWTQTQCLSCSQWSAHSQWYAE